MSKQYAHLHAMAKTSVKFQNDWPKTVGGVALTSQLLTNGQTDGSWHAYIAPALAPKTVGGGALTSHLLTNGQTDEWTGQGTPITHLRANAVETTTPS